METRPKLTTADDLLLMPDDGHRYELVHGQLKRSSPLGHQQGRIAARITVSLFEYVSTHKLGEVYAAMTGFHLAANPDHVRGADAAFVRRERAQAVGEVAGFWPGAPDLAVEVVAPTDTFADVEEKVLDWFKYGTRLVIAISPRQRTVMVCRSLKDVRMLAEGDVLDAGDVIPGWSMSVRELFAP
jgi:Uma2 family endonuclease